MEEVEEKAVENVKLRCGVYGEGSVFSVEIKRDADVEALQEAIFDKKRYQERYSFDASALTLYLAKKNGAWLKDDRRVKNFLQAGKSAEYEEEMRPSWKLDDEELFGDDFEPGDKEIHVLVELPEAAAGEKSVTAKMEKKIDEMHEQVVQTKRKRYVHSKMGSSKGRELLEDLNIYVEPVRTVPFAARAHTPTAAFKWESVCDERGENITLTEEQQRERYRAYVEDNIGVVLAEKKLCVIGVEKGQDILTVLVPDRDIELAGRTDLLVLSDLVKEDPSDLQFLPGVKMLIEVKRAVKSGSVFQALSELIALDLLAKDPVMALLTDLTNNWQFFWVSEMCGTHVIIYKATIKKPGEAFQVIRTLLAQPPSAGDAEIRLPCLQEPMKRRKLAKMLPTISERGESGGIRASIERYYDIASMLGPDIDMARAAASQIARTIPVFSYYT